VRMWRDRSVGHSGFLAYQSVQVSMYHSRNTEPLLLNPDNYRHIKTDL
jgi:hypothetical protein